MSESLKASDDASKAVQKTPNRVTLEKLEAKIVDYEYFRPAITPHMTIAILKTANGFTLVGMSAPADPENFDSDLGIQFAREDAMRQLWQLEGYLLCEKLATDGD